MTTKTLCNCELSVVALLFMLHVIKLIHHLSLNLPLVVIGVDCEHICQTNLSEMFIIGVDCEHIDVFLETIDIIFTQKNHIDI
jgi:hypothetical protein